MPGGRSFFISLVLLALHGISGSRFLAGAETEGPGRVVINEIYYRPGPFLDRTFEFIELFNPGEGAVDLAGWRIEGAASFRFDSSLVLGPGDFVVVCRNRERFRMLFPEAGGKTTGDFEDELDDEGGTLELRDGRDRLMDFVEYRRGGPWPEEADGRGASLQRLCPTASAFMSSDWIAEEPTPGAATPGKSCPPPAYRPPEVVINELNYHPAGAADPEEEFIELYNRSASAVDMTGWGIGGGVRFVFPEGFVLLPDSYVVVGNDAEACRSALGAPNVAGSYEGHLSNRGELVALYDAAGRLKDAVFYGTGGLWPAAPDGEGFSLERIDPDSPAEDPANWASCRTEGVEEFARAEAEGDSLIPGRRFLTLSLEGVGECLIDDVVLEDITDPENTVTVVSEDFNQSARSWIVTSDTPFRYSGWVSEGGTDGSGAFRLVSIRSCHGRCSVEEKVRFRTPPLSGSARYRLSFKFRHVRGSVRVEASIDDRLTARSAPHGVHTAGRVNSVRASSLLPLVVGTGRFPREPGSGDQPLVTVKVRSASPVARVVVRRVGEGSENEKYELYDDGAHEDGLRGDGLWGVRLPALPDDTLFLFTVKVKTKSGIEAVYPRPHDPTPAFGYYVSDDRTESNLDVYKIILPSLSDTRPSRVNSFLSCENYRRGHFVFRGDVYPEVGVRFRGFTGCYLYKRHFKVRFNADRPFGRVRKMNLNSLWTDKALIREHLAWEFLHDIGSVWCETRFVRLDLNGEYYGLYEYFEHPDSRFLERNGLDPEGDLFKALMGPHGAGDCEFTPGFFNYSSPAQYGRYWERETNQDDDFRVLAEFVDELHASEGSREFFVENMDPESLILFQIGQVALHNFDSAAKNFFLYRDPESGRWSYLPWDLDLSFGKYFTFDAVGPGRPVGTLNDLMSCPDPNLAVDPWYAGYVTRCGFPVNWLVHYFFMGKDRYWRRAYLVRFWDVLQEKFRRDRFEPRIDFLCEHLEAEQSRDIEKWNRYPSNTEPPTPSDMESNVRILKSQITCHRQSLLKYFNSQIRNHARLRITEIAPLAGRAPGGGALEFVELYNPDDRTIDIGGWYIDELGFRFPEGTVVGPFGVVVVAADPTAFREAYGFVPFGPYEGRLGEKGGRLRVYDAGSENDYPAVVDFLPYRSGNGWPEFWRGYSLELAGATEEFVDNDRGELWRRSAQPGGTPGRVGTPFRRGDVNQNGGVEIADAIATLGYVFAGSREPGCLDSVDVNADGRINVADAVYLLGYIFAGGAPPSEPFGECGFPPPGSESLGCREFTPCVPR